MPMRTVPFLVALAALSLGGCQGGNWHLRRLVFWDQPATIPGVVSPAERIAELRAQARDAASLSPAEQEAASTRLAEAIASERDPLIREHIVRTAGAYPTETATAILRIALKEDADGAVRIAACEAWGRRGGPEAVELLGQALTDDLNIDVRLAAARALGESRDPAAVPALGEALRDKDPAVQRRAVESLKLVTGKNLGDQVVVWLAYVRNEPLPEIPAPSLAERFRQLF